MDYVIIGASAAGLNAVKTLRQLDDSCRITVVSKDTQVYSRCMLHHVISGARTVEEISFVEKDFWERYKIDWLSGVSVTALDVEAKNVVIGDRSISYDKVLVASGASSFLPPIEGLREATEGVFALRNIEDAIELKKQSKHVEKAVVIGAGLVGMDATVGLLENGVEVHLVEMADRILPLQLDHYSAKTYEELLVREGVKLHTGIRVAKVLLDGGMPKGVELENGEKIDSQLIVVAAGVRPNIDFLDEQVSSSRQGLVVNQHGETSVKDVYGAGDVCGLAPIWPIAVKQGINAAYNMAGITRDFSDDFAAINSMNFFLVPTVSLGRVIEEDEDLVEVYKKGSVYKKIILRNGIVQGAILQGAIAYCGVLTQLIKNRVTIDGMDKDIFDIGYGDFFHEDERGLFSY